MSGVTRPSKPLLIEALTFTSSLTTDRVASPITCLVPLTSIVTGNFLPSRLWAASGLRLLSGSILFLSPNFVKFIEHYITRINFTENMDVFDAHHDLLVRDSM